MKDLFRIISHRFQKNKKQSVSVLAIIITFVMVYSLIMPAVAIERDAAEKEPGMTIEGTASENVTAEAMAEAEPASLEAEAAVTEEAAVEEPVAEEAAAEEPAAEEIEEAADIPAAAPAENSAADNSNVAADSSAAQQGANTGAAQENGAAAQADANQANADSKADPSASDTKTSDAEEEMPAQNFEQVIKYKEIIDEDGNTVDKEIKVVIDAAKDTFPAGTTMKAELILNNADIEKAVEDAVKQAAGELADATSIVQYRAVDITFADKDGQKVEPAKKVEVRITSDKIAEIVNPMLVHVNVNDQNGRVINADVFPKKDVSIIDEKPDTIDDNENTMLFKASRFSPYVIVESQTIDEDGDTVYGLNGVEENADNGADGNGESDVAESSNGDGVLIAESDSYTVTIKYDEAANIPEDAEIDIKEIPEASRQYQSYMSEAEKLLVGDTNENAKNASGSTAINYAKLVDVNIVSATEGTVTPAADVDVDIAYKETEEIAEGTVMQALSFNGRTPEVAEGALVYGGETHVDGLQVTTDKLPVYGIVGTETLTTNYITAEGDTYTITVTYDKDAEIPEGATLEVSELANDNKEYTDYVEQAAKALAEGEEVPFVNAARLFDISIMADGKKVEPKAPVEVKIEYENSENLNETSEVGAVHFKEGFFKTDAEVLDVNVQGEEGKVDGVTFTTESFSIYAVIVIDKEEGTFVFEDENYKITVSYTKEANIPLGTKMTVREIEYDSEEYWNLWNRTVEEVNGGVEWEDHDSPDPRKGITDAAFFDITMLYGGKKVEPDVPLQVKIEYVNDNGIFTPDGEENGVIHFGDDGIELISELDATSANDGSVITDSFSYTQGSFSAVGTYSTGDYIDQDLTELEKPTPYEISLFSAAPTLRAGKDGEEGDDDSIKMTASKHVDPNGDGTSTLHLTLTGQAQSSGDAQVSKVNVVLVVDTSGSMNTNAGYLNWGNTSSATAQQAYESATSTGHNNSQNRFWATNPEYYGQNNSGGYYRIYPVYFSTSDTYEWRVGTNRDSAAYNGTVYLSQNRLEATKDALYQLVDALIANNKPGETVTDKDGNIISLADITEITLIDFSGNTNWNGSTSINDARVHNPRKATTAGSVDDASTLKGAIASLQPSGGTNWEAALRRAKSVAQTDYGNQIGEETAIIFVTDGMPTFYLNNADSRNAGYGGTGGEGYDNVLTSWGYAADDAHALKDAGYTLYSIFAYGGNSTDEGGRKPNDYLEALQNYYDTGTGDYTNTTDNEDCFNATNTTQLQEALKKIANKINNLTAFGAVDVHDGVSFGAINTKLKLANGALDPSSLTYTVSGSEDTDNYSVRVRNGVPVFTIGKSSPVTVNGEIASVMVQNPNYPNDRTKDLECTVYKATVGEGDSAKTYIMPPASLYTEEDGDRQGIEWDLTGAGLIQDGITYDLSFLLWPNQTAYDLVAMLENNEISEAEAATQYPDIWPYVDKKVDGETGDVSYYLNTNWEQKVSYYQVDQETINDTTNYTYNKQPDMELDPGSTKLARTEMEVNKIWNDALDSSQIAKLLYADYPTNSVAKMYTDTDGTTHGYQVNLRLYKADTLEEAEQKAETAGNNYEKRFTLGWREGITFDWSDEYAVAPGVMVKEGSPAAIDIGLTKENHTGYDIAKYNGEYYFILEKGHYYTVAEEDIDDHFILEKHVFHPMVVDSVTKDVSFKGVLVDDPYGAIEVTDVVQMTSVYATNTLRGGINITKTVKDQNDKEIEYDGTFETEVTLTAPKDENGNWDFSNVEKYTVDDGNPDGDQYVAWYRYYDGDKVIGGYPDYNLEDLEFAGMTNRTSEDDNWFYLVFNEETGIATGKVIVNTDYTVRFTNMAPGTEYTLTETGTNGMTPSYSFTHITIETDEDGNIQRVTTNDGDTHIVEANAENNIAITNKTFAAKIGLRKYGDSSANPLSGVKFELYSTYDSSDQTKNVKAKDTSGNEIGTITTENGKATIGQLVVGTYYLVETETNDGYNLLPSPVTITIAKATSGAGYTVTFNQPGHENTSSSMGSLTPDEDGIYEIVVYNESGFELPHTGGSGTLPYTLSGLALIMASALMYGFRMRRRERRLN